MNEHLGAFVTKSSMGDNSLEINAGRSAGWIASPGRISSVEAKTRALSAVAGLLRIPPRSANAPAYFPEMPLMFVFTPPEKRDDHCAWFKPEDPDVWRRIQSAEQALFGAMEPLGRLFRPKATIIEAGQTAGGIYRVQSGLAAEKSDFGDGRSHIRAFLVPGDTFGTVGLMTGQTQYSVEALAPTTVTVLRRSRLTKLKSANDAVDLTLMWLLLDAEARQNRCEAILVCGSAVEKIAAMLYDLGDRMQRFQQSRSVPVGVPISQRDIAEHLGLTVPHVSRTLRVFREAGTINIHYGALEILNMSALADQAGLIDGTGLSHIGNGSYSSSEPQNAIA